MKKKEFDFLKLMYTYTALLFFLTAGVLDLHASQNGKRLLFATNMVNWRLPNNTFIVSRPQARVAGYAVGVAMETTASTTKGLDNALDRVGKNLLDHPNAGLLNAQQRLMDNRDRKMGLDDTPSSTSTSSQPFVSMARLKDLRARIIKLDYKLSETEKNVVAREKTLIKKVNRALINRLKGRILLSVEKEGEAFYVSPETGSRLYLKDGDSAFQILRALGTGATTDDLKKIPVGLDEKIAENDADKDGLPDKLEESLGTDPNNTDTDADGVSDGAEVKKGDSPTGAGPLKLDPSLAKRLEGKFMLQVSGDGAKGQAWYIKDGKRYFMKDGSSAYEMMKHLSTGITNADIEQIPVESINLEESTGGLE